MRLTAFLVLGLLCGSQAYPASHVPDSLQARALFILTDVDHDGSLAPSELERVFTEFDFNTDGQVTSQELVTNWGMRELGSALQATHLFHNIDVNKDGRLTLDPDLHWTFGFFDHDGDGKVTEPEFVVQWQKLAPLSDESP